VKNLPQSAALWLGGEKRKERKRERGESSALTHSEGEGGGKVHLNVYFFVHPYFPGNGVGGGGGKKGGKTHPFSFSFLGGQG